jgi:SAM-dependent methyltransferase
MSVLRSAIAYAKSTVLPPTRRWRHAQSKEIQYWRNTPPYYMPWLARFDRFGHPVGELRQYDRYVDCLPLSTITSRFPFMRLPDRPVVVDLGCGPSGIGYALSHSGATYCIDPLLDEYRSLPGYKEHIFEQLRGDKVLVCQPGESATIDRQADLVFCINVLDHTKVPAAVLDNCGRLMKPGGYLFLMVDGYLHGKPRVIDPLHPHQFSAENLRSLLERCGLTVLHFQQAESAHGGPLQQLQVTFQNVGRRIRIRFGEFLAIATKDPQRTVAPRGGPAG